MPKNNTFPQPPCLNFLFWNQELKVPLHYLVLHVGQRGTEIMDTPCFAEAQRCEKVVSHALNLQVCLILLM